MLEAVSQRFQGSCMMIMQQSEREVSFCGSGFLVHPEGYILTAARILPEGEQLAAVAPIIGDGFLPVTRDEVAPIPLELVSRDLARDVALLRLKPEIEINMPDDILGDPENDPRGALLMSLGIPFGYYRIHNVVASQSILSGRVQSRSGTNLIVFDRRIQYGDIGGPLVSVSGGHVIGVVGGVFDPVELDSRSYPKGMQPINSDLSYASSIEYGKELLRKALEE